VTVETTPYEGYNITYELNGGTGYTSETLTTKDLSLQTPTRSGYTFEGWFLESALTSGPYFDHDTNLGDQTYYAKWEEIPQTEEPTIESATYDQNINHITMSVTNNDSDPATIRMGYESGVYKTSVANVQPGETVTRTFAYDGGGLGPTTAYSKAEADGKEPSSEVSKSFG